MKTLRVYIDTSVIGGYFDEEFKIPTGKLFELFRKGVYKAVISEHTVTELYDAPDNVKTNLETVNYERHDINEEMFVLSQKYMAGNIVSEKHQGDALHIAVATVLGVDVLVSWNFRHIVNLNKNTPPQSSGVFSFSRGIAFGFNQEGNLRPIGLG